MNRFLLVFALLFNCIFVSLKAENFSVTAHIDSSFLFIGEQAGLSFEVIQQKNEKVQLPLFSDTIVNGLELVEIQKPDTIVLDKENIKVLHKFVITSFDTALYYIPPFSLYNNNGDTVKSNPLSLKVFTIDIDTAQYQIADIKPIYEPPFNWKGFFITLLYILLALLVIFAIYWFIRRFIQNKKLIPTDELEPELPAHVIALEMLDAIKNEKRWERGEAKIYYTELTEVLRIYIEKRYKLNAMESTSEEILALLKNIGINREIISSLKTLLNLSDLVKFAKWEPMLDDYLKSLSIAYSFVNETKEIIEDNQNLTSKNIEIEN
jgi:hypothetical protein